MTDLNLEQFKDSSALSEAVYSNLNIGDVVSNTRWVVVATSSSSVYNCSKGGYYGALFKNTETGEYAIASRGTSVIDGGDLLSDTQIGLDVVPSQYTYSSKFTKLAAENLGISESEIFQTGHSLGGALAQLNAMTYGSNADHIIHQV